MFLATRYLQSFEDGLSLLKFNQKGVPEEFAVPAAAWLLQNGFKALPVALINPLAVYGYGDIEKFQW